MADCDSENKSELEKDGFIAIEEYMEREIQMQSLIKRWGGGGKLGSGDEREKGRDFISYKKAQSN